MAIHFKQSSSFIESRLKIENHLFNSVFEIENSFDLAVRSVDAFNNAIYRFLDTTEKMYSNINKKDLIGEKSFPIKDGRYRIFFKIDSLADGNLNITLIEIDDNKQSNLARFPSHIVTFDDE